MSLKKANSHLVVAFLRDLIDLLYLDMEDCDYWSHDKQVSGADVVDFLNDRLNDMGLIPDEEDPDDIDSGRWEHAQQHIMLDIEGFWGSGESRCPLCLGELEAYDGALGYEAARCGRCGYEADHNGCRIRGES